MPSRRMMMAYIIGHQSRLPAEFQEVEYIESTGTQYIDTGIIGKYGVSSYAKIINTGGINDNTVLLGCRVDSGNTRLYIGYRQYNGTIRFGYLEDIDTNVIPTINTKEVYEYLLDNGYATIKKDGTTIFSQQLVDLTFNTNKNLYVFANNYQNIINRSLFKLFSLKIYENNVLVRNLVPCYRKADNVAGLYDLVNGVFYRNAGTGTFIVGGNV